MISNDSNDPFAEPAAFDINANMPISIPIATVAPVNFEGSINDRAATAAAITPIATVMTMRLPLQLFTFLVATIINASMALKIPTAVIPFARFSIGIVPNTIATPAKTAIEIDTHKIVEPTLFNSLSPANLVAAIRPVTIPPKKVIPIPALAIDSKDIPPIILAVMDKSNIAAPIARIVGPTLSKSFPANLVAAIRPVTIPPKKVIPIPALAIDSKDIPPIILAATDNKTIAPLILRIVLPMLSISLPANLVAAIRPVMIPLKRVTIVIPRVICSGFIPPIILTTIASKSIALPIFRIVFPALSIF